MSQFQLIEVKSESDKDYYIEGYVSTIEPDFVNDIVDEEGQKATFRELRNSDITMDEDHNEWRDPKTGKLYDGKKNKYPIAKVVDTKLDNKGTWVRAKLNKFHPDFKERILPMVRDKFLHSFSIAYKVLKGFEKLIGGIKYRVIQDIKLANIAITGNPINKNATFNMALKSFPKMVEENNIQELESQITELKSLNEALSAELTELKSVKSTDYKKMYEELKAQVDSIEAEAEKKKKKNEEDEGKKDAEMKSFTSELSELKSAIEILKKENTELKSFVESPRLKSILEAKSIAPQNTQAKTITMWDVI